MIAQMATLLSVKELREDKAMRALQKARAALHKAEAQAQERARAVEESAASLPARERAIYAKILGEVVGMDRIDGAKDELRHLQEAHQALIDRLTRARDHVIRCREGLDKARKELRRKQSETEKTAQVLEELRSAAADEAVAQEEAEIEDLFATPRAPIVLEAPV